MPYCKVSGQESSENNGTRIFYKTYGNGPIKILLIIGLAGTHDSWGPQIKGLTGTNVPNDEKSMVDDEIAGNGCMEVCAFDNRGMGRSSIPTKKSEYTTTIMAKDAIALMDHLGWKKAHVFGHSMGGMIACKLAALVPHRILSLALLNVTGGGFQCFPKLDRLTLSVAIRFLLAKTPEERAAVDLDTHYSQDYLEERVGEKTRRSILYQEYVKGISKTGMQSNYGFEGQINACWTHKISRTEIEQIRSAGFLISVIHGRHDIIAQISHARRLAEKLRPFARMVDLHGGHLVSHERTNEVNEALLDLIKASECKTNPHDWTNLPDKTNSDRIGRMMIPSVTKLATSSSLSSIYRVWERLYGFLIYLFGVFVVLYEYARRVVGRFKPVRIGASLTYDGVWVGGNYKNNFPIFHHSRMQGFQSVKLERKVSKRKETKQGKPCL